MKRVLVPTTDVNSEQCVIVAWKAHSRQRVEAGEPIADVETSKAVIEVAAAEPGFLLQLHPEGAEVPLHQPIGAIFTELSDLEAHRVEPAQMTPAQTGARATKKALARAKELGVDVAVLKVDGLITVKHVEAAASRDVVLPSPLPAGGERVLLIGGGLGAEQVMEIFLSTKQTAVAVLDDTRAKWGTEIHGVPVCGGTDRIAELFQARTFDAALITIGTSVEARQKFRKRCAELNIPLANAIHPTVHAAPDATFGTGNVINAFCHFGTGASVGDNNFISAYNSYDHHSVIGNDVSTGPGCMSSGRVTIGDRCRFGTGVFIEPYLTLGDDVRVASGAIIVKSIPAGHSVKTRIVTTVVVPNR